MRILDSCWKARDEADTRNHGLWDPSACVVFRAAKNGYTLCFGILGHYFGHFGGPGGF